MSSYRIVQRYAKSLIDLAQEKNALDEVIADVELIRDSLRHRELFLMVKSPVITPGTKRKVFKELFEKRMHEISFAFVDILVRKGREPLLADIMDGAAGIYRKIKGITSIDLITASEADQQLLSDIQKVIEAQPGINQVELSHRVDSDLIGGLVLDFGDERIDASIKHELNNIRKKFQAANITS